MAKVTWTFQSLEDMADIANYHEQNSEQYASFLIDSFFAAEDQLANFPKSGRIVPETNIPSIRELIVNKYRIIYSIPSPDEVNVLAVKHSSIPFSNQ